MSYLNVYFFLTISLLAATFGVANSLNPSSVDPHLKEFQKEFFEKLILKKVSRRQQKHENYPACIELNSTCMLFNN